MSTSGFVCSRRTHDVVGTVERHRVIWITAPVASTRSAMGFSAAAQRLLQCIPCQILE